MPRRACKKDANHDEIADAFRALGWQVYDTYQVGQVLPGWPDLLAAWEGIALFVEVKTDTGTLTEDERLFMMGAALPYYVVRDTEHARRISDHHKALRGGATS